MHKSYRRYQVTYDRLPTTLVPAPFFVTKGMLDIIDKLKQAATNLIALDVYPGAPIQPILNAIIQHWQPSHILNIEDFYVPMTTMDSQVAPYLGQDRVFGKMGPLRFSDYLSAAAITAIQKTISSNQKTLLVGLGASLIASTALKIFCDCPRWELQLQYRQKGSNFYTQNSEEDTLKKYKRGFFHDWVLGDAYKFEHFAQFDFFIDVSNPIEPTMVNQSSMQIALASLLKAPFRLVPYFDPGVWGGQWMKEICDLPKDKTNYAWAFDGVPEENSLRVFDGHHAFTMPAQNLVYFGKATLLGEKVYARFGHHFPIRFDFLDTMQGGNLSLQVHPLKAYIQTHFGMPFTQDESYYILDCEPDGAVYLGVKEGIDRESFWTMLEQANRGTLINPPIEQFVNRMPVKRHDHVSIPAGTIHCSGKNTMVLEISATPYIFTFKLWDWGRLGLDGLPRPVHIQHGKANADLTRTTPFVTKELMAPPVRLSDYEERTGLHPLEFIETRRLTIRSGSTILVATHDSVNMANLVEGDEIEIHSIDGSFPVFKVHYVETFILPAHVKKCYFKKLTPGDAMVIQAYVRTL